MSQQGPPQPPPLPADELNQNIAPNVLALAIVFDVLPFIVVGMRLWSRRASRMKLWWDDYLVIACLPLVVLQLVFLVEAIHNGLGRHIQAIPPEQLPTLVPNYLMWTYASELQYPFTVTLIKSSILVLYIRLFRVEIIFRRICQGLLVFVVAWGIAVLFSTMFQCTPIRAAWDKTIPNAQCIDLRSWLLGTNIPNIVVDFVIIIAPMPLIWNLKLSLWRKLALCGIFALAFATTVISILRTNANANIDITDPTWSFSPIAEFSTIEGSVGVVCACLPTLAPLFRMCAGKRPVTKNSGHSNSTNNSTVKSMPGRRGNPGFSQMDDEEANTALAQAPNDFGRAPDKHFGAGVSYARPYDFGRAPPRPEDRCACVPMENINVRNDVYVHSDRR